jgi:hypothetical protein
MQRRSPRFRSSCFRTSLASRPVEAKDVKERSANLAEFQWLTTGQVFEGQKERAPATSVSGSPFGSYSGGASVLNHRLNP